MGPLTDVQCDSNKNRNVDEFYLWNISWKSITKHLVPRKKILKSLKTLSITSVIVSIGDNSITVMAHWHNNWNNTNAWLRFRF